MNMSLSKSALAVMVVSLIIFFLLSHIMYARLNENTLTQIVQQQSMDTNKMVNMIVEKQKELDTVRNELEEAKLKISALSAAAAAVPMAENK